MCMNLASREGRRSPFKAPLPQFDRRGVWNSPGGMVGEVSEGVDLSSMVR